MSYLRERRPKERATTWFTVGVSGEDAQTLAEEAKAYAAARGVTLGSLFMEALAEYMNRAYLEARQNAAAAQGHE